jgi:hypothetical protein
VRSRDHTDPAGAKQYEFRGWRCFSVGDTQKNSEWRKLERFFARFGRGRANRLPQHTGIAQPPRVTIARRPLRKSCRHRIPGETPATFVFNILRIG